jgi:hypothetical protein
MTGPTWIQTGATVVLVIITAWYAKKTRDIASASRESADAAQRSAEAAERSANGFRAVRWDGHLVSVHGDVAMTGISRRALRPKLSALTNP